MLDTLNNTRAGVTSTCLLYTRFKVRRQWVRFNLWRDSVFDLHAKQLEQTFRSKWLYCLSPYKFYLRRASNSSLSVRTFFETVVSPRRSIVTCRHEIDKFRGSELKSKTRWSSQSKILSNFQLHGINNPGIKRNSWFQLFRNGFSS